MRVTPAIAALAIAAAATSVGCSSGDGDATESGTAPSAARVVSVTDGDTIVVRLSGVEERVRLVGIDTPEVDGPFTDLECFGPEASRRMKALLAPGDLVRLAADPTQPARDRNDRLLAYVFRPPEATSLNARLVQEGFARVYTRGPTFQREDRFLGLQSDARRAKRGLWGACSGAETSQAPASTTATADPSRDCPADRPVKGNLPSGIYHRPGDPSYAATRPERCFAGEAEAEAAGFRAPRG